MYVIWPSLLLALTVLAINVVGDRLRDILDPRLREE
jgi:peptide/nickel transport system permease protein